MNVVSNTSDYLLNGYIACFSINIYMYCELIQQLQSMKNKDCCCYY